MQHNLYINEVRISISAIENLVLLRYRSSELSSGHKRRIERELRLKHQCIAFFEGDVLFGIFVNVMDIEEQKKLLAEYLSTQIRSAQLRSVEHTTLSQMPVTSVERFLFTALIHQAASKGIFSIFGRTLFLPTSDTTKLAHRSTDVTLISEDNVVKMYFTPSFTAMMPIEESYRSERHNLELVGLCKYRSSCSLASKDGSCPYINPGRLGYYEQESVLSALPQTRQELFLKAFENCPKIESISKVVLVKASKGALRSLVYPPYVIHSRLSRADIQSDKKVAQQYRNATLMRSTERWQQTTMWLVRLFGQDKKFEIGHVKIPIEILMSLPHPIGGIKSTSYKAIHIDDHAVTIDQQNPQPRRASGGWLFSTAGAFDREDPHRAFSRVHPYLIVPNEREAQLLSRQLVETMADGEYQSRVYGDQTFLGLNHEESKAKYNCEFINPWEEEEQLYFVDGTDLDYLRKAQDIAREWNRTDSGAQDSNRIVLAIVPSIAEEDDEVTIYHKMKKIFLEEGIPSQFITVDTLKDLNNKSIAFGPVLQSLWLNIYAKLGGKPWRLATQLENVHCFIGIGFGLNPRNVGKHIYAGVANVFDRYGSWIDIASDSRSLSEGEREEFEGTQKYLQGTASFKISQNMTQSIVYDALRLYIQYQSTTNQAPKNIILHKLGQIYECEIIGLLDAIKQILGTLNECKLGILQIEQDHQMRLYGDPEATNAKNDRVVYRGDGLIINSEKLLLATTGRVRRGNDFKYSGIGTPMPLLLTSCIPTAEILRQYGCNRSQFYGIEQMARHAMALTQLHWGSTRDLIRLPITTLYAHKVADLVSKTQATVNSRMRYHRPWFL